MSVNHFQRFMTDLDMLKCTSSCASWEKANGSMKKFTVSKSNGGCLVRHSEQKLCPRHTKYIITYLSITCGQRWYTTSEQFKELHKLHAGMQLCSVQLDDWLLAFEHH